MIIAKRTGLLISVDDALGSDEVATIDYSDRRPAPSDRLQ
jgi:hypothetical protein